MITQKWGKVERNGEKMVPRGEIHRALTHIRIKM